MERAVEGAFGRELIHALGSAAGGLLTWLTAGSFGPAIAALGGVFGAAAGLYVSLTYRRYLAILGASERRRNTPEYQAYAALRDRLREGNAAARLYTRWLDHALRRVASFFGDAGSARRTWAHDVFGLTRSVPLWTAAAFDRCLLIALLYPIATVFLFWAVSGHVGPAEAALHLGAGMSGARRGIAALLVGVAMGTPLAASWWIGTGTAFQTFGSFLAVVVAVVVAGVVAVVVAVVGVGVVAVAGVVAVVVAGVVAGVVAVVVAVVVAAAVLSDLAIRAGRQGRFLALFVPAMIALCLAGANLLAPLDTRPNTGGPTPCCCRR